jgi:putative sterol carrier protein
MSLAIATERVSQNVANAAGGLGATVKFAFNEGGVIFIDGTSNPGTVSNEDNDAACTVSMELSDFMDMLNGDLNPMSAFMGGKMRIDGDMGVAMKLQSVLS